MQDTLNALFRAPLKDYYRRRIIVWRDEDGEFSKTVQEMTLDNARVLVMRQDHMFEGIPEHGPFAGQYAVQQQHARDMRFSAKDRGSNAQLTADRQDIKLFIE